MRKSREDMRLELASMARKDIRYVMFRLKAHAVEGQSLEGINNKILKLIKRYYSGEPLFSGWENFETKWDIGIDDLNTMSQRLGKWWLFGIAKTRVVTIGKRMETNEAAIKHYAPLGLVERRDVGDGSTYHLRLKEILDRAVALSESRKLKREELN